MRKSAKFFGTSLDFWASDQPFDSMDIDDEVEQLAKQYSLFSDTDRDLLKNIINSLSEKIERQQPNDDGEVLEGELPKTKMHMLLAWIAIHKEGLAANWELLTAGGPFFRIDPLR